jgi:anti-sigma B factor antagonist
VEKLIIRTRLYNSHLILVLDGRLTMLTMDHFRNALAEGIDNSGTTRVVIDVSKTEFIDSNGLGALITAQKLVQAKDGYVRLVKPKSGLVDTLRITHLGSFLPQYESVEDAINAGPVED